MKIFVALLFSALGFSACLRSQPAPDFKLSDEAKETSPDGRVVVEQYIRQPVQEFAHFEFWIFDKSRSHACQLNRGETGFSSVYPAGFRFSPNSEWLVRMQKIAAGESTLFLYHREGLRFVPATARPLGDLAWDYFFTLPDSEGIDRNGLSPETDLVKGFDDNYAWMGKHWPSSRFIIISLGSGESGTTPVGPWRCLYDTEMARFSVPTDFADFNRQHKPTASKPK